MIENDLASLEIPAPSAGRVVHVVAKVGDKGTINTPIFEIEPMSNVFRKDLDSYDQQDDAAPQSANKAVFLVHGHNNLIREMTTLVMYPKKEVSSLDDLMAGT